MKKLLSLILCVLLLCTVFSACTNTAPASESGSPEEIAQGDVSEENPPQNDPAQDGSTRPLRLFVDQYAGNLGTLYGHTDEEIVEEFLEQVARQGGPTDIEVEIMPSLPEDRQIEMGRLRVELMAGGGPDVFIATSHSVKVPWQEALFRFPEQAMKRGMFLRLDEYIEKARFMEWEKLNPVIMDAGRIESGQYLLPLQYFFPLTYFLADDVPPYPASTTWAEVAAGDDPALGACMESCWYFNGWPRWFGTDYLSLTWKELVDPDSDTLLISEEDLLQRAKEALALKENNHTEFPHFSEFTIGELFQSGYSSMDGINDPEEFQGLTYKDSITMVPIYCDQGGTVVPVQAYAGINASTERPEDAFFLLDILLSENCQNNSWLCDGWGGVSVCDEITGPMLPGVLEGYREARSQITSARITSPLDVSIGKAMTQYQELLEDGEATEEALEKLISDAYREMKQMLDES